jgi:hypothetical protein
VVDDPSVVAEKNVDRVMHAEGMDLAGARDDESLAPREASAQEAAHPVRGPVGPCEGVGERTAVVEKKGVRHVE